MPDDFTLAGFPCELAERYEAEAALVLAPLLAALDEVHRQGLVHRDIKPANVQLRGPGDPVLVDFGVALSAGEMTRLTEAGLVVGTCVYLAPELLRDAPYTAQ